MNETLTAAELHKAVTKIRHDLQFGQAHGSEALLAALADWLEVVAQTSAPNRAGYHDAVRVARAYLAVTP